MLDPWLGMLSVLLALGATLVALRTWQACGRPDPESVRKGLHIAMSAVVFTFPWLFSEAWPVVIVGLLALSAMGTLRGVLRDGAGRVLHDVERRSTGELCFPVAVGALFVLTGGDSLLYGVPVAVLGLADPAAALVGKRLGHMRFGEQPGAKTVEGSLAFFAIAAGVVWSGLLLAGVPRSGAAILLTGLFVGAAATLAEVVARCGLDNVLVPLLAFAALDGALEMEAAALSQHFAMLTSSGAIALGAGCSGAGACWWRETERTWQRYRLGRAAIPFQATLRA